MDSSRSMAARSTAVASGIGDDIDTVACGCNSDGRGRVCLFLRNVDSIKDGVVCLVLGTGGLCVALPHALRRSFCHCLQAGL